MAVTMVVVVVVRRCRLDVFCGLGCHDYFASNATTGAGASKTGALPACFAIQAACFSRLWRCIRAPMMPWPMPHISAHWMS